MVDRKRSLSRMNGNPPSLSTLNGCLGACNNSQPSSPSNPSYACQTAMRRLQALDFSIVDTVLYLDAYPDSKEALRYYQKLLSERDALKHTLAESCRMPMTSFENASTDAWDWTRGPWPWEADAN